jgi:hypothetical protein
MLHVVALNVDRVDGLFGDFVLLPLLRPHVLHGVLLRLHGELLIEGKLQYQSQYATDDVV